MAYTDYSFYSTTYKGNILTSDNAEYYLERASDFIDMITFGRTIKYYPTDETDVTRIEKSVCAVAESLYNIDLVQLSTTPKVQEGGQITGAVASISSGRESISYTNDSSVNVYYKSASSEEEKNKFLKQVALRYLINVLDSKGEFLIYRGIDNV